ncbi:MAG: aminoacetone oxidase family FAD-binding enzyme [Bacteroidaceae bacterium]|nr:aminoacetone oxidase family FAD-binding enzyme [Bacteroidaceae bacterium]
MPQQSTKGPRLTIIGGGAAGFFLAVNVKRMVPTLEVTICERRRKVLAKVEVSGGGRCNCTNTFEEIGDLRQAYPRGASLLKRLFRRFGPKETYEWFERHGVPLTVQEDQCVFPQAQDSHAIIDCLVGEARRLGVRIRTDCEIDVNALLDGEASDHPCFADADFVAVTIGGTPRRNGCVPSLFTFNIHDEALQRLMGTVVEDCIVSIPGTKMRAQGALLVTHWGMSGPAILRLSSYAARMLADNEYRLPLIVNWVGETNAEEVRGALVACLGENAQKQMANIRPFGLPSRLWEYLLRKASVADKRCAEASRKDINRLTELLTADPYSIAGRCHHKEEFVTCGGVSIDDVDRDTLESKRTPNLFFAGEVLDIDGITGGFNLQAAWTTAYTVAEAIRDRV